MALTEEELAAREGLITGSIAPAVHGVDEYKGQLTAALQIVRRIPSWAGSAAAERGDLCEPACLEYAARTMADIFGPLTWRKAPFVRGPDGWSGDTTDALYYDATGRLVALGEAKTTACGDGWGTPYTDQVPDHVLVQCCWHLHHWPAAEVVWVPVLMGGYGKLEFQLYQVNRNQELIDHLVAGARDWYERHIVRGEPVTPDHRDIEALRALWPRAERPMCEMTAELARWAAEKHRWRAVRKAAEQHEDTARARIIDAMGPYGAASNGDWSITYRNARPTRRVDWKALALSFEPSPEQLASYMVESGGARTLTVTKIKPKTKKQKDDCNGIKTETVDDPTTTALDVA